MNQEISPDNSIELESIPIERDPELSFRGIQLSTPVPQPPIPIVNTPTTPINQIPSQVFTIDDINRPHNYGPVLPNELIIRGQGTPTGQVRRTVLAERIVQDNSVALPLQRYFQYCILKVKSVYRLPFGTKYWKIYQEYEVTTVMHDTSKIQYRFIRL